jgi:hypothetical protein
MFVDHIHLYLDKVELININQREYVY